MSQIVREIRNLTKSINNQNKLIRQCFVKMSENQKTRELRIILKILFTDVPPIIDQESINRLTDKNILATLEAKYDTFLNKNQEALCLYELIDEIFDIRDYICIRHSRVARLEKKSAEMV